MSEVAGRLSAQVGAYYLMKPLRRPRPADGRRARRAPGQGARARRRHRRLQRRADRAGDAGRRDGVRAQRRPHARARREPRPHRAHADVEPPRDRRGAAAGRPRDRRRARPRRQGAAPRHPRHARRRCSRARCWSTSPSTRAAASRPRSRRRTPTRPTWSTASSTTASRTCPAPCRSRRPGRSRTSRCPYVEAIADKGLHRALAEDPALALGRQRRGAARSPASRSPRPSALGYTPLESVLPLRAA